MDIQDLVTESMIPVDKFLTSKEKADRSEWCDYYELSDFSLPKVVDSPSIKKKFKIQIEVLDSRTGLVFSKTLFFGEDSDYIFTKDKSLRLRRLHTMTNK